MKVILLIISVLNSYALISQNLGFAIYKNTFKRSTFASLFTEKNILEIKPDSTFRYRVFIIDDEEKGSKDEQVVGFEIYTGKILLSNNQLTLKDKNWSLVFIIKEKKLFFKDAIGINANKEYLEFTRKIKTEKF